ncbi:MAG: cobalamin-binding protein [Chloroflexi bacterium]|nr:cobalamin-binding protein [Chloroflexota bacterium]
MDIPTAGLPQRIVCLTAETPELLWRLGAWDQVVGVSGFTTRPPQARQKPRIGAFTTIRLDKVLALQPDLVVSFSDLQAEPVRELVASGCNVLALNQRSLKETLDAVLVLGAVVGREPEARALVAELSTEIEAVAEQGKKLPYHPRVYFEEWPDPLISGIRWVSEIIELAGGQDIFPELRERQNAGARTVTGEAVRQRDPEVIIASWCGKKVQMKQILERDGWNEITAVKHGRVHEIKSAYILQPGPVLVEGLRQVHALLARATGAPTP